ncbi:hypothetical protein LSM04_006912 [Trypanosoma melophagium]|uniref:uncharacterized protein n=1 Tax=Trypanosoma melophagium TaxID=715481 RepID=UPI00351A64B3|nr:hypothetical protein LSM04_006912 [Trypanosoma melophagium]
MTQNCSNEVDISAEIHEFLLAVRRKAKLLRLSLTRELHFGFWAYKCVKPFIVENWEQTWVILDGDSRLLFLRPNTEKPELTIVLDHVLNCQLSAMLFDASPTFMCKERTVSATFCRTQSYFVALMPQKRTTRACTGATYSSIL